MNCLQLICYRRDGCCCCIKYKDNWTPNKCSQNSLLDKAFTFFAKYLLLLPVKLAILGLTVLFMALGIFGVTKLEAEFKVHNLKLIMTATILTFCISRLYGFWMKEPT